MSIAAIRDHTAQDQELRQIYAATMEEMIRQNNSIISMDADLMRAASTVDLWDAYPDQVIACGIAEANMIGVAAGLSSEGYIPFVHSFAPFMSRRVFDQIYMSCAYAKLNVKIIASDPGVTAALNGGTHTANEDIAMMRAVPGVTIIDVTDAVMAPQILRQAAQGYGVFYIRYPRGRVERVYSDNARLTIGESVTLQDGKDLTIIACGMEVAQAVKAAAVLKQEGICVRVIDMFTVSPLDVDAVVNAARTTGAIVTSENHSINGGLGSAVAEALAEYCPVPMERVGNTLEFGDVGSVAYLMDRYRLTHKTIAEKARKVLTRKRIVK